MLHLIHPIDGTSLALSCLALTSHCFALTDGVFPPAYRHDYREGTMLSSIEAAKFFGVSRDTSANERMTGKGSVYTTYSDGRRSSVFYE